MILDFQKIIQEVCKHHKVSVYKLSEMTGISEDYLGKLARGVRHQPSLEKAMQILKYHPDCWYVGNGQIKRLSGGEK